MRCATHVGHDAIGVCKQCSRGVCEGCSREVRGVLSCEACLPQLEQVELLIQSNLRNAGIWPEEEELDELRCSFCGEQRRERAHLVEGARGVICSLCVGRCERILAWKRQQTRRPLWLRKILNFINMPPPQFDLRGQGNEDETPSDPES